MMSFASARGNRSRPGGWRRPSFANASPTTSTTSTTPAPPFGELLSKIRLTDLDRSAREFKDTAVIRNVISVASFNWQRASKPTIVIPGSPPRWSPPNGETQLREDQGNFFRDRNAAQYPKHPMEPAVIAGLRSNPDLAREINVVGCSSTLGNLLRFVRGQDKSFRILAQLVENTLFLIRRENSPTELIPDVRGYGHTFPEAYTNWDRDVKQSTSHQRVLRYSFGGLDLLVRFEADGYIPISNKEASKIPVTQIQTKQSFGIEDLTTSFQTAEVGTERNSAISSSGKDNLVVKQAGAGVSRDRIFDLKTRALWKKNQDLLGEEIPRLWIAQISNFVTAYHQKGLFKSENIDIRDVEADIAKWEKEQQTVLAQLAALLHTLISKAHELKDKRFEICRSAGGDLELRAQLAGAGDALSSSVKDEWIRSADSVMDNERVDLKDDVNVMNSLFWDDGGENDYTACTSACRYCGRCTY